MGRLYLYILKFISLVVKQPDSEATYILSSTIDVDKFMELYLHPFIYVHSVTLRHKDFTFTLFHNFEV